MPDDTFTSLRSLFDGNSGFMTGHQILTLRKPNRGLPAWAATKEGVQRVLLTAFPNLETDEAQRRRAGQWARVIQIHFRANKSCRETAHEMGATPETIRVLVRQIQRFANDSSRGPIGPGNNGRRRGHPQTGAQRKARHDRRKRLARLLERMETTLACPELPEDIQADLESDLETVQEAKETLDAGCDVSTISTAQERALSLKIDKLHRWYISYLN